MVDAQLEKVRAERAAQRDAVKARRGSVPDRGKRCGDCAHFDLWSNGPIQQGMCRGHSSPCLRLAKEVACRHLYLDKPEASD